MPAVEVDAKAKSIPEVDEAIKSFEKRDFEGSLRLLEKAKKAHPELPPPPLLLAQLAFVGNQPGLIRPALERAAVEAPANPEVFVMFGDLALLEVRTTDAAVHFEKARLLAGAKSVAEAQRKRLFLMCDRGDAQVAELRGDWKAARTALASWLAAEPANTEARRRFGRVLFKLDKQEDARREFERAAKDDPKGEPPAVSMGWLYTNAGNLKKAEEWMNYAADSTPKSVAVQTGVANWLLQQGRGDEAKTHVDAALKLDPKSQEIKRQAGLVARQRKDFGEAEKIFQPLADSAPGDAWLRSQLALVLAEQKDEAKQRRALELAELSVRLSPKDATALATLGTVYYRLKRLDDAEKLLQAVVSSGKGTSDTAYFLALVKADRGKAAEATPLLKTALDAPGLFIFRSDARAWLDRLTTSK
jgi:tetratricopeptide (TPR) repeat protein